ncbi:hypothetical protein [Pseudorhodoplanes sp.]|uniref:hypothetical protein n=1 Tax=Pseudorhodoplanes sp. TaxID=1934341 RepID=UPI00391AC514
MTHAVSRSAAPRMACPSGAGSGQAEGFQLKSKGSRERSVMMRHNLNLFPWRNVIDNVAFGTEIAGVPRQQRSECAQDLINLFGRKRFAYKQCRQLSGGMRLPNPGQHPDIVEIPCPHHRLARGRDCQSDRVELVLCE